YLGEIQDRIEPLVDFLPGHPEDDSVYVYVLAAGQFWVETDPDRDQRSDAPAHAHLPLCWRRDAGEHPEHRRLPRAVAADDSERLSRPDRKVDLAERPEMRAFVPRSHPERMADQQRDVVVLDVPL